MRKLAVWCMLGVTFLAAGCGGGPVNVRGRVLLDDVPIAGVTVMLMPIDQGHPATGLTDADGTFRLTTFQREDGALPGQYKIVVTKTDAIIPPPEIEPGDAKSVINHYKDKGLKVTQTNKKKALPAVYGDAARTPLRCTVPTDGELVVPLQSNAK
jgi:hypothetical protein